jgi:hypothetical protein
MSKIGVGVGEDFPVDDGHGAGQSAGQGGGPRGPRSEQDEFEDWKRRRDQWRSQREQWRAQRDEWRARRRAFKRKIREAAHESFGQDWDGYRYEQYRRSRRHGFGPLWVLIPVLGVVLFFSLIAAIFKAPFAILAVIAICALVYSHHNRYRFHRHHYDYDMPRGPIVTPPPPKSEPPAPPPAVTNGN